MPILCPVPWFISWRHQTITYFTLNFRFSGNAFSDPSDLEEDLIRWWVYSEKKLKFNTGSTVGNFEKLEYI